MKCNLQIRLLMQALLSLQLGCAANAAAAAAEPVPCSGGGHASAGSGCVCTSSAFGASLLPMGSWAGRVPKEALPCR